MPKRLIKSLEPKNEKVPRSIIVVLIIVVIFVLGWISGILPYSVKYVQCGKAPTTIEHMVFFAGSDSGIAQELGDEGYGPGFMKTYLCEGKNNLYPDNTPVVR